MYKVELDEFEGPLDLLLYFIKRDELDIYDIPISKITADYMETLNNTKEINLSIAGDFIHMAATLMRIKSKMLIPGTIGEDDTDGDDPRLPLVRQLLEYKQFREAAQSLSSLAEIRSRYFSRSQIKNVGYVEEDVGVFVRNVSLFDIAKYFKTAIDNKPIISTFELHREFIRLDDQKAKILAFIDGDGSLRFSSLIRRLKNKIEIIVTFLAILDLIRESKIMVVQNQSFDDLEIHLIIEKN
jgi:segregation and condensation protein A